MPLISRRRVSEIPAISVMHTYHDDNHAYRAWSGTPIPSTRPPRGRRRTEVVCQDCPPDAPALPIVVDSQRRTKAKRWWLLGCWLLSCLLAYMCLQLAERLREGFPVIFAAIVSLFFFYKWWKEDGVTIDSKKLGHHLAWRE